MTTIPFNADDLFEMAQQIEMGHIGVLAKEMASLKVGR
jgi:hypothetical protein